MLPYAMLKWPDLFSLFIVKLSCDIMTSAHDQKALCNLQANVMISIIHIHDVHEGCVWLCEINLSEINAYCDSCVEGLAKLETARSTASLRSLVRSGRVCPYMSGKHFGYGCSKERCLLHVRCVCVCQLILTVYALNAFCSLFWPFVRTFN